MMEDGAMMKSAQPSNPQLSTSAAGSQAPDHSTTNVQVQGVDEADFIKNDGNYIYTISGGDIVILAAYPAENAKVVARIPGENGITFEAMFVEGDRLMAIGRGEPAAPSVGEQSEWKPEAPVTAIEVFDLKDRTNPRLVRTVAYEGGYSSARLVDGNAHVVLTTHPYTTLYDKKNIGASDIIPGYRDTNDGGGGRLTPVCGYEAIEAIDPRGFSSFMSILSLSMRDDAGSLEKRVIAGDSENVYASAKNIYIATTGYQSPEMWDGTSAHSPDTTIFKFKLDGASTKYSGSAKVPGTVLNQFSMDESGGYFRIATTRGYVSRENATSTNNVYVLDDALKLTGKLEGLAPGEKIYSARFMGDKAYMVTFKKVDPFFVLDMSNPENPRVLGELKIPGYSDYLHPYDENHVIGVGKNTVEGNQEGTFAWYQGMKIALFDVTDVANPKEMFKIEIGDRGTDSYALEDHMAFLFDREKNLLVVPIMLSQLTPEQKASSQEQPSAYGSYTYQGAFVYDISLAGGIKEKGRITHMGAGEKLEQGYSYYDADSTVRRSLYIGDNLYTVSEGHIKINRLGDLAEVANISLSK